VAYTGTGPSTATVSMNGLVRTATFQSMWRVASDETIRLTLKSESAADETVIRFNEDATNEFDGDLDAFKMMNGTAVPSIYTMFGSTKYSINSIADPYAKDTIAVYTKIPADGDYILSIATSDPAIEYVLVDKKLGTETVVTTRDYSFAALKTDDLNRFDLQMRQTTTTGGNTSNTSAGLQINSSTKGFVIQTQQFGGSTATIQILDMTGNLIQVLSNNVLSSGSTYVPMDVSSGAYLVKVTVDGNVFTGMISLVR
uniref:T9SS type A sorting domain-containing protein n=1 Tax=Cytophaga aurantiaca TaxID=29530 RepID=UPI0012FC1689